MSTQSDKSFQKLANDLQEIIDWFESEDADLDTAVEKFEAGMKLSKELQKRLRDAEQKITKLSAT